MNMYVDLFCTCWSHIILVRSSCWIKVSGLQFAYILLSSPQCSLLLFHRRQQKVIKPGHTVCQSLRLWDLVRKKVYFQDSWAWRGRPKPSRIGRVGDIYETSTVTEGLMLGCWQRRRKWSVDVLASLLAPQGTHVQKMVMLAWFEGAVCGFLTSNGRYQTLRQAQTKWFLTKNTFLVREVIKATVIIITKNVKGVVYCGPSGRLDMLPSYVTSKINNFSSQLEAHMWKRWSYRIPCPLISTWVVWVRKGISLFRAQQNNRTWALVLLSIPVAPRLQGRLKMNQTVGLLCSMGTLCLGNTLLSHKWESSEFSLFSVLEEAVASSLKIAHSISRDVCSFYIALSPSKIPAQPL